jgi:hypothetical protein
MRNIIKLTQTQLCESLRCYGTFNGVKDDAAEFGPMRLAEIVMASHSLSDAERRDAYNVFVAAYAAVRGLPTKQSQRAISPEKGFNFIGLTIDQRSKAGDTARKTMQSKLYCLQARTPEAAKKLAAKLTAPRVKTVASRTDKVAKFAKVWAGLTPAMQRDIIAAAAQIKANKAA